MYVELGSKKQFQPSEVFGFKLTCMLQNELQCRQTLLRGIWEEHCEISTFEAVSAIFQPAISSIVFRI